MFMSSDPYEKMRTKTYTNGELHHTIEEVNKRTDSKLQSFGSSAPTLSMTALSLSIASLTSLVISSAEWFHAGG